MTVHRKAASKKRSQGTAHYRAMAKPEAQKLVSILRPGWTTMGFKERGERLRELLSLGCSARGLQMELNQSATSIRRYIELAELPEKDRKAIEAGASAKKTLALKATADRHKRRQQRVDEDRTTGALSNKLATTILEFCRVEEGPRREPVSGKCAVILFNQARSFLEASDAAGYRKVRVSNKKREKRLFNKTRPPLKRGANSGWHQGEWLANIVWTIAPERPIWDSALKKAERRIKELEPKRTPLEAYNEANLNRQARLIELTNLPARPMCHGARLMQRQGRPTPTPTTKHL
jgi:hypothetical protein